MTFIESMKSFYFLINQIEDGQVMIKNEISDSQQLIPSRLVEINIKNEIIYPNEENHQVIMGSVIQHSDEAQPEPKRKKRKVNKRKPANGETTMEIDETGNIVARQIVTTQDHQQVQSQNPNIHITQQNDNEMALMLTVKHSDGHEHSQPHTITVSNQHHSIHPIQLHSSEFFLDLNLDFSSKTCIFQDHPLPPLSTVHHTSQAPLLTIQSSPQTTIMPQIQYSCSSCNEIFANTDTLRQHLFHSHQIIFPPFTPSTDQYQVQLPQVSSGNSKGIQ